MLTLSMFCGYCESSVLNSVVVLMKPRGFLPQQLGGMRLEGERLLSPCREGCTWYWESKRRFLPKRGKSA